MKIVASCSLVGSTVPPTETMMSPTCSPATDAGAASPSIVVSTLAKPICGVGSFTLPKKKKVNAKISAPSTKWVPGPAKIVMARCHRGLAP